MASRLTDLFVKNVSAVDKPANKRKFLVVKSNIARDDAGNTNLKGGENMSDKKPDASSLKKIGHSLAAMFGRATGADDAVISELEKAAGELPDVPQIPAEVTEKLAKAAADNAAAMAANEALKTRLEKAETETKKLREEADLRKFADEVTGYKEIGLDPEKDAALLKSVTEKLSDDEAKRIREIFKSAVAQKAASNMFKEVGSSAGMPSPDSALAMIEAKCGELMQKNDKLTREEAQSQVFRANPGLYERWRQETTVKV